MPRLSSSRFALAFALMCSCSGGGGPTDGAMTLTSASGKLHVELRTAPSPPSRGECSVTLTLTDPSTHAPLAGLTVAAITWMPAMGHGASVVPTVAETSPGVYVISNVDFFMPGTWELRTTVSGTVTDHVEPQFQIP